MAVLAAALTAVSGCSGADAPPLLAAAEAALDDPRVPDGWLEGGSLLEAEQIGDKVHVVYVLGAPRSHDQWPEATCAVEHDDTITAVEWQVSAAGEVEAVSPVWGEVSCLTLGQ